jgi:transaldolase
VAVGNPLQALADFGQSVWYDNISRTVLQDGTLAALVRAREVRGVTSNPAIFEKAIGSSGAYDADIRRLKAEGRSPEEIYDALAIEDIRAGADLLRPVWEETQGGDGYISLEVSPTLAEDAERTVADAVRLHQAVGRPNLMIKIPATRAGWQAIEECIARGLCINVTMMFALRHYDGVADAYMRGLERRLRAGQEVSSIHSVASVFVSRYDTLVDRLLEERIAAAPTEERREALRALRGRAALANAKLTYARFRATFSGPRWEAIAARGGNVQRPLWASTSTKNPAYRDVLYAEELIGPDTVDTMPPQTIEAFRDHGRVARTVDRGLDAARATVEALRAEGIDLEEAGEQLQREGIAAFAAAFAKMLQELAAKAEALSAV